MKGLRSVAVVGGVRIPFCRAGGKYAKLTNLDMMGACLSGLVRRHGLDGKTIGDVSLGAVIHHSRDWNLAREAVLRSGLSRETPGFVVQRACGTGLEAAILIASKIATGQIECGIAGGVDSMSDPPLVFQRKISRRFVRSAKAKTLAGRLKPWIGFSPLEIKPVVPEVAEPTTGKTMGEHCEMMAKEWKIPREEQDRLALKSHQSGIAAYARGFYKDLVIACEGQDRDDNLRADTSLEKLAALKTSFDPSPEGTLTAGNSSPLTDGASCVLLASEEWAKRNGLEALAYFHDCETAAVDFEKEGLLMAPAYAVARMVARQGIKLQDFDFYEIHEAFAAQVLCTLKAWESAKFCGERIGLRSALGSIDRARLNVVGGSVALGHPFGATGGRLVANLAKLLSEKGSGRGLISICTGGGMAVTAILQRPARS